LSRRVVVCVFFVVLYQFLFSQREAFGDMQVTYPRSFSFSGIVELTYKDYNTEIKSRYDNKSGYSVFQQKYSIAAQGYIYNPKLAVFSSRLTFLYNNVFNSTSSFEPDSRNINYELSAIFLPYRPVSLSTYATVNDFKIDSFSWGNPLDNRIVNYGAVFGVNLRNFPTIRFEYYHLDITPTGSQITQAKTINNSYYLLVKGLWLKMKTNYSMNFGLTEINNPNAKFQNRFVDLYANTAFKMFSWINFFRYIAQENVKMYGMYSNLQFNRWEKFYSDYFYSFEHEEDNSTGVSIKTVKQELRGSLSYKFQSNLQASLSLDYGTVNEADQKSKYDSVSATLHYSRPVKNYYLSSFYRFTLKKSDINTSYTEHTASIQLTSKSYKWGTFFATYYFSTIDGSFKFAQEASDTSESAPQDQIQTGYFQSTSNSFSLGLRGRALKKVSWLVEGQYIYATASKKRPLNVTDFSGLLESGILETSQKKDYFILMGEFFFPLGKRGTLITLRAGDAFGTIDSGSFDKKYYEIHLSWPVKRNLRIVSWWREAWYNVANTPQSKIREYNFLANYRIGSLFIDGEYWVREDTQESHYKKDTRLILKVKRLF
jgi:hypothetical protein